MQWKLLHIFTFKIPAIILQERLFNCNKRWREVAGVQLKRHCLCYVLYKNPKCDSVVWTAQKLYNCFYNVQIVRGENAPLVNGVFHRKQPCHHVTVAVIHVIWSSQPLNQLKIDNKAFADHLQFFIISPLQCRMVKKI